jgi:hypothetical protein
MKPHPRIRKTIKWGGAAVAVLLGVVWIGTGYRDFVYYSSHTGWLRGIASGGVVLQRLGAGLQGPEEGWNVFVRQSFHVSWMASYEEGRRESSLYLPLWPLLGVSAPAAFWAWRLDVLARRRALNLCPKCRYDRTGLAASAVCPECGAAPAAR